MVDLPRPPQFFHLNSPPMEANFYCQIRCGSTDFSIEGWNKSYHEIQAMPISEAAKDRLVHPDPCKEQCFDCMAVVGETRRRNAVKYGWDAGKAGGQTPGSPGQCGQNSLGQTP